ncbi:MAG TPA: hypothetical protein VN605_08605, partial [Thermoanaerobaculia bacterium]|nr:hypothetical protein [Thermoanaerobaculia bacterium]
TTDRFENIVVSSTPAGADATLRCGGNPTGSGVTPATIRIRRTVGDCDLTVAKEGFAAQTFRLERGINRAYWLNMPIAALGPVGAFSTSGNENDKKVGVALMAVAIVAVTTDFWTGAVHDHDPKRFDVVLKPNASP